MLARLEEPDKANEKRRRNQRRDILIAETAIRSELILISGDANLRTMAIEFGGRAIDREQLMRTTTTV
jgi:predicted nuclease of predicted toxin-antitoxin system